ncbi:MAG: squalene--hopene cyclase [Candidatus Omnitrophica bacterium]|nr:squalene--hopene cyclase [Candidatus Omnitrophota bacterium]
MSIKLEISRPLKGPAVTLDSSQDLSRSVQEGIHRASDFLLRRQSPAGYWVGELEADTTLESDSIKLWHLLGRVDPAKEERLVRTIRSHQLSDGGWPIYAGGPAELNATVKGYVALRLAGTPKEDPALAKARAAVHRLGGLERVNSFEKVYLALLGAYPWDQVPALPPELILLPTWFPFNIYEISYWSRTILVPLAVVYATRPAGAERINLDELWIDPSAKRAKMTNVQPKGAFWRGFFLFVNRIMKIYEVSPWKPWRAPALRAADRWIVERLVETDGLGAIFPAMFNAVFALKGLGYGDGDPQFERAVAEMERLELPDGDLLKVQPCFSPVWDTGLALYVLGKAGCKEDGPLRRAVDWLKAQEIRVWGDWAVKNRQGRPGGWAFQFKNPFYPDVDDTAQVLLGFEAVSGRGSDPAGPFRRGLDWILSMQNKDGGWSSYDKNNNCLPLTHFPFADHNAMLDSSAPDITGRVLELLVAAGTAGNAEAIRRGVAFLKEAQKQDGTWFGRWGVSYIYGSWLALRGLKAAGEPIESLPNCQRAGQWLVSRQNLDGGWGESCRSYDDPTVKGQGPSTGSQTAWALMSLISLGMVANAAFRRGLEFLLTGQQPDGNWPEELFTGTGFPKVFYLKYHLYRTYFPLLALVEARSVISSPEGARDLAFKDEISRPSASK